MTRWLIVCLLGLSPCLQAGILSEFSCVRPSSVDAGTWHNVSLAASLVDGVEVAPGAEFSFLKEMDRGSGGFWAGNTLYMGRVIKSIGGGYCQVSTTIYNAALLAGLTVTERHSHSFYDAPDAYVDPGLDAAVSGTSHSDFRFLNSTNAAVTLHVWALAGRVSVQILGSSPMRRRWISTEKEKIPMESIKNPNVAPRPGFDGWVVHRILNVVDSWGNTHDFSLGTDHYAMVVQYE